MAQEAAAAAAAAVTAGIIQDDADFVFDPDASYEEITVTSEEDKGMGMITAMDMMSVSEPSSLPEAQNSQKDSPQQQKQKQKQKLISRDSSLEDLMDSSLEDMDYQEAPVAAVVVENTTFPLPVQPVVQPLPILASLPMEHQSAAKAAKAKAYHQESPRTRRRKQLESDEIVSDEDGDESMEGADDIDSVSSSSSKSSSSEFEYASTGSSNDNDNDNRDPNIRQQQKEQSRYADFYDDITDEEDGGGGAYEDDEDEEYYFEEIELPDTITPIRKVWRNSLFFGPHWTRMEQISEGEEEDELEEKENQNEMAVDANGHDGEDNNSLGSISLKGDKSQKSNDLDKSWTSLDSHKRSWHSSHTRQQAAIPGPPDDDDDDDGDDAAASSPRRSPPVRTKKDRAARKAERKKTKIIKEGVVATAAAMDTGSVLLLEDDTADTALASSKSKKKSSSSSTTTTTTSSSTKPKKSRSVTEKKVLNKEYREEHNLNDSLRGNRTALLKAKKKAAAAKAAAKKKMGGSTKTKAKKKGKPKGESSLTADTTTTTMTSADEAAASAIGKRTKDEEDGNGAATKATIPPPSQTPLLELSTITPDSADSSNPKIPKRKKSKVRPKLSVVSHDDAADKLTPNTIKSKQKLKSPLLDYLDGADADIDNTEHHGDDETGGGIDLVGSLERSSKSKSSRRLKAYNNEEIPPETMADSNNNSTSSKSKSKRKSKTGSGTSNNSTEAAAAATAENNKDADISTRSASKSRRKLGLSEDDKSSVHSNSPKSRRKSKALGATNTSDEGSSSNHAAGTLQSKQQLNEDGKSAVPEEGGPLEDNDKPALRRGKKPGNQLDTAETADDIQASPKKRASKSPKSPKRLVSKDVNDLVGSLPLLDESLAHDYQQEADDAVKPSKKVTPKSPKRHSSANKQIKDLNVALSPLDEDRTEDSYSMQSLRSDDASKSSRKKRTSKISPKSPKAGRKSLAPVDLGGALSLLDEQSVSKKSPDSKEMDEDGKSRISSVSLDASRSSRSKTQRKSKSPKPRKSSSGKPMSMPDLSGITATLIDDDTDGSSAEQSRSTSARKPRNMPDSSVDDKTHKLKNKPIVKTPPKIQSKVSTANKDDGGDDETASLDQPGSTSTSSHNKGAATAGTSMESLADTGSEEMDQAAANPQKASKRSKSMRNLGSLLASEPAGKLKGQLSNATPSLTEKDSTKPRRTMSMFSRPHRNQSVKEKEQDNRNQSPNDGPPARNSGIIRALLSPMRRSSSFSTRNKKKSKEPSHDTHRNIDSATALASKSSKPAVVVQPLDKRDEKPLDEVASNLRRDIITQVHTIVEDGLAKARESQKEAEEGIAKEIGKLKEAVENTVDVLSASFRKLSTDSLMGISNHSTSGKSETGVKEMPKTGV